MNMATNEKLHTLIITHSQQGNLSQVEELLRQGADVDKKDSNGTTALWIASKSGHSDLVEVLLSHSASVDTENTGRTTALWIASGHGHSDVVEVLLSHGAATEAKGTLKDVTPLHVACQEGHLNVVKCLKQAGACVNAKNINKFSPLHYASDRGHLSVVEELLRQDAEVHAKDCEGRTAFWWAVEQGHYDVVGLLLSHGADTEVRAGDNKTTALHVACDKGRLNVVKCLILAGANVNAKDIKGFSPLHCASKSEHISVQRHTEELYIDGQLSWPIESCSGQLDVVKLFLSHGAGTELSAADRKDSPLHVTCQEGYLNIVKCLLTSGANVNATDENGVSPLHYAPLSGNLSVVEELLKQGAEVDAKDSRFKTALLEASARGHSFVVELLLSYGADPEVRGGYFGATALHVACQQGNLNVVKCLIQAGAPVHANGCYGTPLHCASRLGNLSVVEELLRHSVEVETKDGEAITALWAASFAGHADVVELLLSHGADTEVKATNNKATALRVASQKGHWNVVKYLLQAGANVNAKNIAWHKNTGSYAPGYRPVDELSEARTALWVASFAGHSDVVALLLSHGADTEVRDGSRDRTPFLEACHRDHMNVVKCFIQARAKVNDIIRINGMLAACFNGNLDMVQYLHKHDFDIYATDLYGNTSLIQAAQSGNLKLVKWLVDRKLDVNKVANDGRSALHAAAVGGHIPVMEYLLDKGINIDITDKKRETPVFMAFLNRKAEALQWLLKQGAQNYLEPVYSSSKDINKENEQQIFTNYPEDVFIHGKDDTTVQWNVIEKRSLFETCHVKVATVGELKSGKTSLARSLISSSQYRTRIYERTVVMEQRNWRVSDRSTITIVDLGGHKSYHNTGYFFIANHPSNVVLLCHEITSKRYHVTYFWLRGVITRAPRCHIVPVLTKKDLVSSDTGVKHLVQEFLKEMEQFMNKDIEDMEIKQYMTSTSRENKLRIKVLIKRYKQLKEEFPVLICVTSTASLQEKTIDPLKTHITQWGQNAEFGVKLPQSNYQFYSVTGGLGSKVLEPIDHGMQVKPTNNVFRKFLQQEESTEITVKEEDLEHLTRVECYNRNTYIQSDATKHKKTVQFKEFKYKNTITYIRCDDKEDIPLPTKTKPYITFEEAKQTFQAVEKSLGKLETSDEETKILLRSLHHRGLVLWFQGSSVLENIVFNNLQAFTSVLKTVFNHDVHQFLKFNSMAPRQKVLFENRKMKFESSLKQLTEEGLMTLPVLQCLLLQSDCDLDHIFITSLLQKLNLGYKYEAKDETMLFIPYFIESRLIPLDLYLELAQFRKSTSCEVSLVSSIQGNLSQTFFNFVMLKMFEYLQKKSPLHQWLVWGKGMKAPLGTGNMLLLFHGHQCIDLVIKCPPKDLAVIWKCISYFCNISKELRNVWWPGLSTGITLKCAACAICNNNSHHIKSLGKFVHENQCELELEALMDSEAGQDVYICSEKLKVPIGLAQPVRENELPQRISDVENKFLQQPCISAEHVQSRSANAATDIVHEMVTSSYFCLADDMESSLAEHFTQIGAISKDEEQKVDHLYRMDGPNAAVCKLIKILSNRKERIDTYQMLVSIMQRENPHVVEWFAALYCAITGKVAAAQLSGECFATAIKPPLKIFSYSLNGMFIELSQLCINDECFSTKVKPLIESFSKVHDGMKVRDINMISNNLSQVPDFTHPHSILEDKSHLDLSFNQISDMNSSNLPSKLQVLNLSFNHLEFIPSLAHLSMLRELDISHNRIRKVAGLPAHLKKLRLWSNPLKELSQDCFPNQGVYAVVKRAVFKYMWSELRTPPADVFKQGYTSVATYFDPSHEATTTSHAPFTQSSIDAFLHNPGWIERFSQMVNFKVTRADLHNIISAMLYSCYLTYPGTPTSFTGTGFFLGFLQQHSSGKTLSCIATSYHHIPLWTPSSTGNFVFDRYDDVSGNYTAIAVTLDQVIWSDERLDYAIFAVENDQLWQRFRHKNSPLNFIFMPESPSDLPEDKSVLFLLGHPGGSPMHVDSLQIVSKQTIMNDPNVDKAQSLAKFGVNSSTNLNALEDEVYLYYYCTSFGGTSGAPCYRFAGGQVKLYAMHSGGMHTSKEGAQPEDVSDYEIGVYMCAVIRDIEKKRTTDFTWK